MKNRFGIVLGGLQKKMVFLVLTILVLTVAVFAAVSLYQNNMLVKIVGETRTEQQQAISQTSKDTMHQVMEGTLVNSTALQARIADNDFAEIVNDTYMLQTMAQGLIEKKDRLSPAELNLPDSSLDGVPSAMVLCEEGVDYTQSEYLAAIGHMSSSMLAMFRNSDKIAGCFIGLADGTHFGVDDHSANRFDENGDLIPFPVRERPWYRGAAETGDLYFTGIEKDAFSGSPVITCSVPLIVDGETVGVAGIDIVLDSMSDFINASSSSTGFAVIVNDNGQVILAPESNEFFEIKTADESPDLRESDHRELAQFVEKALAEPTELTTLTIGNREYYVAGAPMPTVGWTVISVVDKEITEQPEKAMLAEYDRINDEASLKFGESTMQTRNTIRLILVLLFLVGVCAALIAAGRIVKPLEAMTNTVIDCGRTGQLFTMQECFKTNDEIEVLADAFADLSLKTRQYIEDITVITQEKERVNTELNMANKIQSSMLPHIFPAFPNRHEFDIYASMVPAKEVGGDFYDFFLIDDDHLCMVMADVSGKGVPAALFMMISKVILQNFAMLGKSPSEILERTNTALCSGNQVEMFVTVWLGILEISTGKIIAANAGHEYPATTQDGRFAILRDRHGFIIGGMDGMKYKEYELQMHPGDRLFLYTDGVPEATDNNRQMFGTDRMIEALNREPDASPERVLENIRNAVDDFVRGAEPFDDLTMLCIEYKGPTSDGPSAEAKA